MLELIRGGKSIPAMSEAAIERVRGLEAQQLAHPPLFDLEMHHLIHGGVYYRTCYLPAGVQITGALVKIATTLIIVGDVIVWLDEVAQRITGHHMLPASAYRKQAFRALADTMITMIFPTDAKTVAEAEQQFTDQWRDLAPGRSRTIVTGEPA